MPVRTSMCLRIEVLIPPGISSAHFSPQLLEASPLHVHILEVIWVCLLLVSQTFSLPVIFIIFLSNIVKLLSLQTFVVLLLISHTLVVFFASVKVGFRFSDFLWRCRYCVCPYLAHNTSWGSNNFFTISVSVTVRFFSNLFFNSSVWTKRFTEWPDSNFLKLFLPPCFSLWILKWYEKGWFHPEERWCYNTFFDV